MLFCYFIIIIIIIIKILNQNFDNKCYQSRRVPNSQSLRLTI